MPKTQARSNLKPLLIGAGVLLASIFAYSTYASASQAEGGEGDSGIKPPPAKGAGVAGDAAKADAVFGVALVAGGPALISATNGLATPVVGSILAAVSAGWTTLSPGDKANVWRGKA